ncbi:MAG: hypothetical protein JW913_04030 [Chitinispirillaceae bacterium]|nr:hypothetical protein [Chitinispirillaceae bacterium]
MKPVVFCIILLLSGSCIAPVVRKNLVAPVKEPDPIGEKRLPARLPSGSPAASKERQAPPSLPIVPPQWPGMTFVVLPKQEFARPSGYELYLCKKAECDSAPTDPAWEHDNHRIRCEAISGDSLLVETVEPDGDEWLVTFFHIPTNKKIFGRTHLQALQDIAPADDLEEARRRWLGMVVFARRGVISTYGTNSASSLTGLRINIQDPLTVVDVRWGKTPLPVKPIWLMVTSAEGKSSFIPVRYSWTNTIPGQISRRNPWDEEILEDDPIAVYHWDDETWELINNHRVIIGMTPDQVRISWGEPVATNSTGRGQQEQQTMTYLSHELVFSGGKLNAIKERPASSR